MADSTFWWIAAGVLVATELVTGSVYLLMLAAGMAAGAVAAHAGLGSSLQLAIAAAVGGGATIFWHFKRPHATPTRHAGRNRDMNLDIGETVQVDAWQPDGSASVKYRGALWSAVPAPGSAAAGTGAWRIVEVRGSQLVIEKIAA